jgi:Ca2+-binding EF-hand superfamily protein
METGGKKYEYKEADFMTFFDELDKDHSGSIDKGEMFNFIKKVLSGEDILA